MKFLHNQKAFTLAEVLITLLIVGVISSIVIPNIFADIEENKWSIARERTVYTIREAMRITSINNGGLNAVGTSNLEFRNELSKYLTVSKVCDVISDCFHTTIKNINGDEVIVPISGVAAPQVGYNASDDSVGMILNNGILLSIIYNPKCTENLSYYIASDYYGQNHVCANFIFDTNGFAPPNRVGKDIGFATAINPGASSTLVVGVMPVETETIPNSTLQTAISKCVAMGDSWHLPSKDELNSVSYNKVIIGNYDHTGIYWSSTQDSIDPSRAWYHYLGRQLLEAKTRGYRVRCVKR